MNEFINNMRRFNYKKNVITTSENNLITKKIKCNDNIRKFNYKIKCNYNMRKLP